MKTSEINNAKARFSSKRKAGISVKRSDGSKRSEETDVNSALAEKFAAAEFQEGPAPDLKTMPQIEPAAISSL